MPKRFPFFHLESEVVDVTVLVKVWRISMELPCSNTQEKGRTNFPRNRRNPHGEGRIS